MAGFNLVRNSRVFLTTNVAAGTGVIPSSGFTTSNTFEIQVLDGFSFSQATQSENITLNEAGDAPVRGQRAFNTALAPAEFSFSTYLRPRLNGGFVKSEESVLWNALAGTTAVSASSIDLVTVTGVSRADTSTNRITIAGTAMANSSQLSAGQIVTIQGITGSYANQWNISGTVVSASATSVVIDLHRAPLVAAGTTATSNTTIKLFSSAWVEQPAVSPAPAYSLATFANSNKNQLQAFGLIFMVDNVTYLLDNCALDQAVIDFGLEAIATVAWTGKGSYLRETATAVTLSTATDPVASGGLTGTFKGKDTSANFIANKLSTVTLTSNINGVSGTDYTVALTGGSITIANTISYLTPANLGVVNIPITYFTSTRAISGSMTAYLRTGSGNTTATLLKNLLANASTSINPKFKLQFEIGGRASGTRVEIEMPGAMLAIPTVETQSVVSTTINFTAQGSTAVTSGGTGDFDIEATNDATIRYYSL